MTTYKQAREALKASILAISTDSGYNRTLLAANFCKNWEAVKQNKGKPVSYPKIFLSTGDIESKNEVSRRKAITAVYYLTIVVLESADEKEHGVVTPADEQIEAIAEDIEKKLIEDYTLAGLVMSAELSSVSMDSGFAHPEGIAIFEITVKWHKQY